MHLLLHILFNEGKWKFQRADKIQDFVISRYIDWSGNIVNSTKFWSLAAPKIDNFNCSQWQKIGQNDILSQSKLQITLKLGGFPMELLQRCIQVSERDKNFNIQSGILLISRHPTIRTLRVSQTGICWRMFFFNCSRVSQKKSVMSGAKQKYKLCLGCFRWC